MTVQSTSKACVAGGEVTVVQACRHAGISRSRFYELRARYRRYGETGPRPKPRPERRDRRLVAPLVDAILTYAIEHPTEGPRSIAATAPKAACQPPSCTLTARTCSTKWAGKPTNWRLNMSGRNVGHTAANAKDSTVTDAAKLRGEGGEVVE